jgi:spore germination protein KB
MVARLVASLNLRFPGKTLFEYAEEILGRVPGKIVGILYIWWFLHTNALVLDEFGSFLCIGILPNTPSIVFFIIGAVVAAYAVRSGLEVLGRYTQLFLPLMGLLFIVFLLSAKYMKVVRLLPVLDTGLAPILKGAAAPASWLGEIVVFSMIIPFLTRPKEAYRVAAQATLFTGFFLLVSVLVSLAVFGPNLTRSLIFPTYNAVRVVSIANFLERMEAAVVTVWMLGGFAKIGVFYYAAVLGSAQLLGLKEYRPLVAPVGVILVALALLCENLVVLLDFLARVFPPYSLILFEAGIPLVLLIVALARGKEARRVD